MPRVSALTGELILDINKWTANAKQAQTDLGALSKAMSPLTSIAAAAGAGVAAMGATVAAALISATKTAADYGDKLRDAAVRTGLTTESLAGLKIQAEQSGTSFETLTSGMKILSKNMEEAIQKGGSQRDAFKAIGVSVEDLRNANGQLDPVLRKVADGLARTADQGIKTQAGIAIMGRGFTDLTEVMQGGSEGMDLFRKRAELFGLAVSRDATDAADAFNDALNDLKQALLGTSLTVGNSLIPTLTDYASTLTAVVIVSREWLEIAGKTVAALAEISPSVKATSALWEILKASILASHPELLIFIDDVAKTKEELGKLNNQQRVIMEAQAAYADMMRTFHQEEEAARKKRAALIATGLAEIAKIQKKALDEELKAYQDMLDEEVRSQQARFDFGIGLYEKDKQARIAALNAIEIAQAQLNNVALDGLILIGKESEAMLNVIIADIKEEQKAGEIALKASEERNEKLAKETEKAAEKTRLVWATAVGSITADFTKGLADVIFEGKKFQQTMGDIAKDTAKGMFTAFLTGLLTPLTSKLAELGGTLAGVLFGGGAGQAPAGGGGGAAIGGIFGGGGGGILGGVLGPITAKITEKLGGIFGKAGGTAAGGTAALGGLSLGAGALTGGLAAGIPMLASLIGGIGGGRKAADVLVQAQNALQREVEAVFNDLSLSATNRSKIIENLFSGFQTTAGAFAAGGTAQGKVASQAFATLAPWMTNIRTSLAAQGAGAETTGAQAVNNYNIVINLAEGKNARATAAIFNSEIIPAMVSAIQANTGGITAAIAVGVKNSSAGVVTT